MAQRKDLTGVQERSAEDIRQDIAAKRESILETVDRLGTRIQEKLDWREWVAQYPYVALGAAAGLGFLLSGIFKPRPSPGDRVRDALAETVEEFFENLRESIGHLTFKAVGPRIIKVSVGTMITKAVIDSIKKKAYESRPAQEVPGGVTATSPPIGGKHSQPEGPYRDRPADRYREKF